MTGFNSIPASKVKVGTKLLLDGDLVLITAVNPFEVDGRKYVEYTGRSNNYNCSGIYPADDLLRLVSEEEPTLEPLPEGYEYTDKSGNRTRLLAWGEYYEVPTLAGWADLPEDLITAMAQAHAEAGALYGDEGGGYDAHLMLAYLLGSEAFKKYYEKKDES